MGRVVFISDAQTPLGEELVRCYLADGASVAAARSSQEGREAPRGPENDGVLVADWNRRSPISARNVLLSALNRYGRLDEALILETPTVERSLLQELAYDAIEREVDAWIKGTLFLIKGVLEAFGRTGGGVLALVHHIPQETGAELPPLEAAIRGSFKALTESLLATSTQKGVAIHGFESFTAQAREFAAFIADTLKERGARPSGRWFRYQPKGGFLRALRI